MTFCTTYGAALTAMDIFNCFLNMTFGGDYTIVAIAIIGVIVLAAYKFNISSTVGLAIAWPVLLFLYDLSSQSSQPLAIMLVLVSGAIGIKVFLAVLARLDK
jgi:hypothetical protein